MYDEYTPYGWGLWKKKKKRSTKDRQGHKVELEKNFEHGSYAIFQSFDHQVCPSVSEWIWNLIFTCNYCFYLQLVATGQSPNLFAQPDWLTWNGKSGMVSGGGHQPFFSTNSGATDGGYFSPSECKSIGPLFKIRLEHRRRTQVRMSKTQRMSLLYSSATRCRTEVTEQRFLYFCCLPQIRRACGTYCLCVD